MSGRNISGCLAASVLAVLGAAPGVARAQVDPPPSPEQCLRAFDEIASWIPAWRVPEEPDDSAFPAASAASVTIRLDGKVIGRGDSVRSPTCVNAARSAVEEALSRLPVRHDALKEQSRREHARRTAISLELAGSFVPLRVTTVADVDAEIQPGLEGVAVRIGTRVEAMFPSTMLTTRTSAGDAVSVLIRRLRPDAERFPADPAQAVTPDSLIADGIAIVYRFRTIHVAQPSAGQPPVVLHRGGRVVESGQVTSGALAEIAGQMASNLIARRWPGAEAFGMVGTIDPVTGRSEPMVAQPYEQALAVVALRRYARVPGVELSSARHAQAAAAAILEDLADVESSESAPWDDPASSAMCVIAVLDRERRADDRFTMVTLFNKCAAKVRASFDPKTGFVAGLPVAARGDISLALVRLALESDALRDLDRAERAIRDALIEAGPGGLPAMLPWIGFAELELARGGPIPSAVALRDARELVWTHQMTPADADSHDRDLIGGIVFTTLANPLPSWHSSRPVAFLAAMLREPQLTEADERGGEIVRLVRAMRFLRQLMADRYVAHMYANPRKAIGGVRSALWDQRMPIAATALSLIAVCELMESLSELSR